MNQKEIILEGRNTFSILAARAPCGIQRPVPSACATSGGLFGTWVDIAKATPTDTTAWVLVPNGADRRLSITVLPGEHGMPTRHETVATHGTWYGSGQLADTV